MDGLSYAEFLQILDPSALAAPTPEFLDPRKNPNVNQGAWKLQKGRGPVTARMNNPGAISNSLKWGTGAERGSSRPAAEGGWYAKYPTPEHGVDAAASLLKEKYKGKTLNQIANKWAAKPGSDYAPTLAKAMGIGVDDVPNLDDPNAMVALLEGQSAKESGFGKPLYSHDTFVRGVNKQFGNQAPLPPVDSLAMPNTPQDMMPPPAPPPPMMAGPPPGPSGGIGGVGQQLAGMSPGGPPSPDGFGGMAQGLQSLAGGGASAGFGMANNQPLGPSAVAGGSVGVPNGGLPAAPQYGSAQINPAEVKSDRGISSAGEAAANQPLGDTVKPPMPDRNPGPSIKAQNPTPISPIDKQPGGLKAPAPKKPFVSPPKKPLNFGGLKMGGGLMGGGVAPNMGGGLIQGLFGGML